MTEEQERRETRAARDQKIIDAVKRVLATSGLYLGRDIEIADVHDLIAVRAAVSQLIWDRHHEDGRKLGLTHEQVEKIAEVYAWVVSDNADDDDARDEYGAERLLDRSLEDMLEELAEDDMLDGSKLAKIAGGGADTWAGFDEKVVKFVEQPKLDMSE